MMKSLALVTPQTVIANFPHHGYSNSRSSIPVAHTQHYHRMNSFLSLKAPSSSAAASSSSSSSTTVDQPQETPPQKDSRDPSFSGCKGCGKEKIESGCNGEGRIQGGIATFPGLGWWPIKAYRPCPGFLASGGNYKRQGQSMDEVAFGGGKKASSRDDVL